MVKFCRIRDYYCIAKLSVGFERRASYRIQASSPTRYVCHNARLNSSTRWRPQSPLKRVSNTVVKNNNSTKIWQRKYVENWTEIKLELKNRMLTPSQLIIKKLTSTELSSMMKNPRLGTNVKFSIHMELLILGKIEFSDCIAIIKILDPSSARSLRNLTDLMRWSVSSCIKSRNIINAANIFLRFYDINPSVELDTEYGEFLIKRLIVHHSISDESLVKYLEILQLYRKKHRPITTELLQDSVFCDMPLLFKRSPLIMRKIMDELLTNASDAKEINRFLAKGLHSMIDSCYRRNDPSGVFIAWYKLLSSRFVDWHSEPRTLYKIIKVGTHHRNYRAKTKSLISDLSPVIYCNNALILPAVIDFASKCASLEFSRKILDQVRTHLKPENYETVWFSKSCLTSMLRLHLVFNDSQGVDKILRQFQQRGYELSDENYASLVTHLLKSETLTGKNKAIDLLERIPDKKRLLGYSSLISYLVQWKLSGKTILCKDADLLIDKALNNAKNQDPTFKSSLWQIVGALYIKQLLNMNSYKYSGINSDESSNLDLARIIFLRSLNCKDFTLNPFRTFLSLSNIIRVNIQNKLVILKNIASVALKFKRKDIFMWACAELYKSGMVEEDIVHFWNMASKHQLRNSKIFDYKQLKSIFKKHGKSSLENFIVK